MKEIPCQSLTRGMDMGMIRESGTYGIEALLSNHVGTLLWEYKASSNESLYSNSVKIK